MGRPMCAATVAMGILALPAMLSRGYSKRLALEATAKIDARVGPRLDSDHRPVIADIALIE